ncbi:hypothetical protein DPMN_142962 [Dreissena polymorpha]|uniref:Uncharacterized protein n=1 Tax=Dreissena polymorpha TaxID=45954 RepID=A0A9D4JJ75_DREPO|nr:hypothetical protein DPMN_142962 [Dreissena polymorpha]
MSCGCFAKQLIALKMPNLTRLNRGHGINQATFTMDYAGIKQTRTIAGTLVDNMQKKK